MAIEKKSQTNFSRTKLLSHIAISAALVTIIELIFGTIFKSFGMPMRGCVLMLLDSTVYIYLFKATGKRGVIFICGITAAFLVFFTGGAFKFTMLFPLISQSFILDLLFTAKKTQVNYIKSAVISQIVNIIYRFFLAGVFSGSLLKKIYGLLASYQLNPAAVISIWIVFKLVAAAILAATIFNFIIVRINK
ncbi:MptD family putative ECF transporter S component [bacterium]|nr:MptD family putative ECF transporter S component [bacterium]